MVFHQGILIFLQRLYSVLESSIQVVGQQIWTLTESIPHTYQGVERADLLMSSSQHLIG